MVSKETRKMQNEIHSLEIENLAMQKILARKSIITKSEIETERDGIESK